VCENRRVSSSLRVSSLGDDSHEHDSNIKDNVEPVTWPTIETQLAYWSSRRRSDFRCAAIRSAVVRRAKRSHQYNRLTQSFSAAHTML
jgi:hypothetical protein